MIPFKLNFELFNKLVAKFDSVEKLDHPRFFYETETEILIFQPVDQMLYCTIINKATLEDLESFKLEHLNGAFELLFNPLEIYDIQVPSVNLRLVQDATSTSVSNNRDSNGQQRSVSNESERQTSQ